jgi:hypothetical protein
MTRREAPCRLTEKVGTRGFEPPTSSSRTRRATRLRYVPTEANIIPAGYLLSACKLVSTLQPSAYAGQPASSLRSPASQHFSQVLRDPRARQSEAGEGEAEMLRARACKARSVLTSEARRAERADQLYRYECFVSAGVQFEGAGYGFGDGCWIVGVRGEV